MDACAQASKRTGLSCLIGADFMMRPHRSRMFIVIMLSCDEACDGLFFDTPYCLLIHIVVSCHQWLLTVSHQTLFIVSVRHTPLFLPSSEGCMTNSNVAIIASCAEDAQCWIREDWGGYWLVTLQRLRMKKIVSLFIRCFRECSAYKGSVII